MWWIILLSYLLGIFITIALLGYFKEDVDAEDVGLSLLWPVLLPIILLVGIGIVSYLIGRWYREGSPGELIQYIKKKF